jgi:hypothetical protein
MTDEELIKEFEKRNLVLSKRVLTYWRAKGFLPPLCTKGLGRGRGKVYFWPEPDILSRALLVDEALQLGLHSTRILFILWLFGYEIPSSVVRRYLLECVVGLEALLTGNKQGRGAVEEHIEDLTVRYCQTARLYPELGLPEELPPIALEMILNVFGNSSYDLSDAPFEDGIAALASAERQPAGGNVATVNFGDHKRNTELAWRFVYQHFSLSHIRFAISEATDEDVRRVQSDLGIVFSVIAETVVGKPELAQLREYRVGGAYLFGALLCPVDLTLRHQGWGGLIDEYLERVESGEFSQTRTPVASAAHCDN